MPPAPARSPNHWKRALDLLVEDKYARNPLVWIKPPTEEVGAQRKCSFVYRSGEATQGGGLCMVKEFELKPYKGLELPAVSSPRRSDFGGGCFGNGNQIELRVHERDLHKCKGDLDALMRCDLDNGRGVPPDSPQYGGRPQKGAAAPDSPRLGGRTPKAYSARGRSCPIANLRLASLGDGIVQRSHGSAQLERGTTV